MSTGASKGIVNPRLGAAAAIRTPGLGAVTAAIPNPRLGAVAAGIPNPRLGAPVAAIPNPRLGIMTDGLASSCLGTGWLPDLPDLRDRTISTSSVKKLLSGMGMGRTRPRAALPKKIDLSAHCSPVEDQGQIGSCTAHAVVGLVEYFERRAFGKHIDGSRLFVYKATRRLMGWTGDTGAYLRTAMSALALCGVPPEKYWPYTDDPEAYDHEPEPFVYAVADNFEALEYFCHDPFGSPTSGEALVGQLKAHLAGGIPFAFGFYGFPSFASASRNGDIPMPGPDEGAQWGHAVMGVGYDDAYKITNTSTGSSVKGAFKIRNSWGKGWGDDGYGWIPYEYVVRGLASDFWSLMRMAWVDTKNFGLDL